MRNARRSMAPVFVAAGVLANVAGAAAADRTESLTIKIQVSESAQVPRDVLERGEQAMTAIYRRIGVNAEWSNRFSPAAERVFDVASTTECDFRLTLLIVSADMTAQMERAAEQLGFAPRNTPLVPGRAAYVFYDRVEALARSQQFNLARLLGQVMAHEIGHMLLPYNAHSLTGIMRGRWDKVHLLDADRFILGFSHDQSERIRATVSAAAPARCVTSVASH